MPRRARLRLHRRRSMTTIATIVGSRMYCLTVRSPRRLLVAAGNTGDPFEMTATDRDEVDDLPAVRDPLGAAIGQIIAHIFEALPTDCAERKAALTVAIGCHS